MLSKSQFEVLSYLIQNSNQDTPLKTLTNQLDWSHSHTSRVVNTLITKDYLRTTKQGRNKHVTTKDTKPLTDLKPLLTEYSHVDFASHITGSALEILYYLDQPRTATELTERTTITRATVYRKLDDLQSVGIIGKAKSQYQLNDDFTTLSTIARGFAHHEHRREAEDHSTGVNIIWETHDEYLLACDTKIDAQDFHLTGPHQFEAFDIPLIPRSRSHYLHSTRIDDLTPAELVCHTLLIDDGARYRTYALLLITHKDINHNILRKHAHHYNPEASIPLLDITEELIEYLHSEGDTTTTQLPSWTDFKSTATDYGITL